MNYKTFLESRGLTSQFIDMYKEVLYNSSSKYISFPMKNIDGEKIGTLIRNYLPESIKKYGKSRVERGGESGYFYHSLDYSKPLIITEGEIDFLSIYSEYENCIGIQGVQLLSRLLDDLESKGITDKVLILIDNDESADIAISKLDLSSYSFEVYDARDHLLQHKDINEYLQTTGKIDIEKLIQESYFNINDLGETKDGEVRKWYHHSLAQYLADKENIGLTNDGFVKYFDNEGIWKIISDIKVRKILLDFILTHQKNPKNADISNTLKMLETVCFEKYNAEPKINKRELNLNDCIYNTKTNVARSYRLEDFKFFKLPYSIE